jgi:hypothetical protein
VAELKYIHSEVKSSFSLQNAGKFRILPSVFYQKLKVKEVNLKFYLLLVGVKHFKELRL